MNQEELEKEVAAVMEWPYSRHVGEVKATMVVQTVKRMLTEALHRGETIMIMGLGTFRVKIRPAKTQRMVNFKGNSDRLVKIPARKRVVFVPHPATKRFVNEGMTQEELDSL